MPRKPLVILLISRAYLYIGIVIFLAVAGWWYWRQPSVWTSLPLSSLISGRKIVIDAGHGGGDPGAKSPHGLIEKDLNLDVALRLKKYLSRAGIYTIMIRETDRDFFDAPLNISHKKRRDLTYRIGIANRTRADLLISIHANSFPQVIYRGAQTFYNPKDLESKLLAEAIQNQLVRWLGPNRRRAKTGDYRVLNDIKMPGVIVEIGFLSNAEEARQLSSPAYREKIAAAIYHGIIAYYLTKTAPGERHEHLEELPTP
ncbi:MAG: N-acetylmuramoyl-L-alanine amidase [Firmicutes bacterium]|nr:N-acetylmuramoyl-L-alanine amidase [Bacillota bacterium]